MMPKFLIDMGFGTSLKLFSKKTRQRPGQTYLGDTGGAHRPGPPAKRPATMYATLAQIQVAYIVTQDEAMPQSMTYVDAGNMLLKYYGDKAFRKLLDQCQAAISANPYPATYQQIADKVKGMRVISKG
jgi:hypothetical protein